MQRWTRVLALVGLAALAVLAAAGGGSAAPPTAPSSTAGQLIVGPWELAPEPGQDAEGGEGDLANAPFLDASHQSDMGGGGGGGASDGVNPGFNGLDLRDQRNADSGNQQSVSPPDQGLCTNGLQVL